MNFKTKRELLKWTDSYWDMLPSEIKDLVLEYKESQELIDWRERIWNRNLCREIGLYYQLRQKWQVGHIECRVVRCDPNVRCECMRVYGWYRALRGDIQKRYLGISLEQAIAFCDFLRASLFLMVLMNGRCWIL